MTQDIRPGSQGVGGNQGLAGIWPGKEWPADYRPGAGQALQVLNYPAGSQRPCWQHEEQLSRQRRRCWQR